MGKCKHSTYSEIRVQGWDLSLNHGAIVQLLNGQFEKAWYVIDKKSLMSRKDDRVEPKLLQISKKVSSTEKEILRLRFWLEYLNDHTQENLCFAVGLEDYAFGKANRAHQIGELGGVARMVLWESKMRFRLCDPLSVKMFGAGNGMADKDMMRNGVRDKWGIGFEHIDPIPKPGKKQNHAVSEDLIDAFVIAQMVWAEVQLRAGKLNLSQFSEKEIQVFMRTTKKYPVNLLGREWLRHRS